MKTKNKNSKKLSIKLVIAALILSSFCFVTPNISAIYCNSEECKQAQKAQQTAANNAAKANEVADTYENKVEELNNEIAAKEREIAKTEDKIEELNDEIEITKKRLKKDQEAIVEILIDMHLDDSEPIMILAGSESISDLAEKEAREEIVKQQLTATANKVKADKEELESKKQEVNEILERQQNEKKSLAESRAEQQRLVEKYKNDAEAYKADAIAAQAAYQAAYQKYVEDHKDEFGAGNNAYYGSYNSYPWQGDCPGRQDDYLTYWSGRKIGGYVCECVSYAGWKAYETFGIAPGWGHAYSWASGARNAGYRVDKNPAPNTIGQSGDAPYGHVFWVEGVNADGSINVTEYNNAYATQLYSGSFHYGDFGSRVIPAYEASKYNYIHFD